MVTCDKEVMKIQKYYVIFVYIFQGKMGKNEKKTERKSRNYSDQNTKNQKTKIWDEQNNRKENQGRNKQTSICSSPQIFGPSDTPEGLYL